MISTWLSLSPFIQPLSVSKQHGGASAMASRVSITAKYITSVQKDRQRHQSSTRNSLQGGNLLFLLYSLRLYLGCLAA